MLSFSGPEGSFPSLFGFRSSSVCFQMAVSEVTTTAYVLTSSWQALYVYWRFHLLLKLQIYWWILQVSFKYGACLAILCSDCSVSSSLWGSSVVLCFIFLYPFITGVVSGMTKVKGPCLCVSTQPSNRWCQVWWSLVCVAKNVGKFHHTINR